jgi:two-component system, NarL family, response regulator DegU
MSTMTHPAPAPAARRTVRVLLVDDHRMLREGLRRSIESYGFEVVGEASDGEAAVRMAGALLPDVALLDVTMPVLDGVEACRRIRQQFPSIRVIMLTMHADRDIVTRAVKAGASGYLAKSCSTDELAEAVRTAARGEALSPEFQASVLRESVRLATPQTSEPLISKREEEVLQLIADGLSTTDVARKLYISVKTVKNHLASIYQKLDTPDRTGAVVKAVKLGIIRID